MHTRKWKKDNCVEQADKGRERTNLGRVEQEGDGDIYRRHRIDKNPLGERERERGKRLNERTKEETERWN